MRRVYNPDIPKPLIAFAGASGRLGQGWEAYSSTPTIGLYRSEPHDGSAMHDRISGFDVTDRGTVFRVVEELGGRGVRTLINSAGKVGVDPLEPERGQEDGPTFQANVIGAANVADACREAGMKLIHLSTKCVIPYDGEELYPETPILDGDPACADDAPTWYGITNARGEQEVHQRYPEGSTIVRLDNIHGAGSALLGGTARHLQNNRPFSRVSDMYSGHFTDKTAVEGLEAIEQSMHEQTPTPGNDINIYHLGARTVMSPYEVALALAHRLGASDTLVTPMTQAEYIASAQTPTNPMVLRPGKASLSFTRYEQNFGQLPTVDQELDRYLDLYRSKA